MNEKSILVMVLAVLAVAAGAYIYFMQPEDAPEADPWAGKEQAYMEDFADSLASSSEIYLVMDLRGATDDGVRRNIMQCAVDMSSSTAIGVLEKRIYSLDSECISIHDDGTTYTVLLEECLAEINAARDVPGKAIVYVMKSNETMIFENELVVGIGGDYTQYDCLITARSQAPALPPGFMNQTARESELNLTGGEEAEGEGAQ